MTPPSSDHDASQNEESPSVILRRYMAVLRKRIWVVIAIVTVGITGAVLYTMRQPQVFEATASVVVNPQAPRVNKDDEVIELGAGSVMYMRDYYNTQIEVLTSFPLARATVLQGEGQKLFERIAPREQSPDLAESKRIDLAADRLIGMLTVDQHKDSRIIAIHVRSVDADLAQLLANAHVTSYLAFMLGKRTTGSGQASEVLSAQLDDAQKGLRAAEDKIIAFKAQHDLSTQSFDDKQNTVVADLQRYTAALADAKVRVIALASERTRAKALSADEVLESPIFGLSSNGSGGTSPNPVVDELKAEYVRAKQHFLEIDATFGPKSDEQRAAKRKVDDIYAQLQSEAKRAMREIEERYAAAVASEQGYEGLVAQRKKDTEQLDKLYAEYAPLVRDQKYAENQFAKLTARLDSSHQEAQNGMINVDKHESARNAIQVLPRMRLNIILATILSLFFGIGMAVLLDQLDRTIKGTEGIEQLVGSPLLGIIPIVADVPTGNTAGAVVERDLYVLKHPTSQAAECCRSIRTNILFSAAERPMKTITVSSPRPREGKTTTTIYMGTIMAQSGQRVLLIDTDLRRPRLHASLGVSKERGLTNLLLGDCDYDDVIKTTEVTNLYVLPCGPLPPNPAELLMTKRFKAILEELSSRFDRILLDSPPLLAVTDAVVLTRTSDGVILVAQAGKTHVEDLKMAVRQLRDVDAPILGVILNVIDVSDRRYGGYYYAYGGYGGQSEVARVEGT